MNSKHTLRHLAVIILLLAGIAGTAHWIHQWKSAGTDRTSTNAHQQVRQTNPGKTARENSQQDPTPQQASPAASAQGSSERMTKDAPETGRWVKRTIASEWVDGPDKLVGRQRVRIVEADFKYPLLRLEESVTLDPVSGEEKVELIRGSVADHLLLSLKEGVDFNEAADAVRALGYEIRAMEPESFILAEIPKFEAVTHQQESIKELMTLDEFINYAEPDYLVFPCITPNDPAFTQGKLWGLHNPGNSADATADADIDAPEGWDILKEAPDIVVAVTDTGIQYTHEDLVANMWVHPTNGSHGFDAYDNDNTPMDVGGHGTHCAGTIGATGGNGIGMTGVAWDVQLMALRFLGPNGGATSDAIRVVNYARQNGAHIISASWGGGGYTQGLFDAIKACSDAGIPFVAAAGNSSANNDATPHYPSSYKLPNIVAVASTTKTDKLSNFSCYGRTSVDIGAPGSSIWSTYTGANNSYTFLNGTSMATPHVSGALALAKARFPTEDMASLIDRLYASTDKIPALAGKTSTGGRLNLARLLGGSPPGVFNDHFANAHRIEGNYGSWSGSNAGATRESDENSFSLVGIGNKSVWLAFQTPHTGIVTLDVTNGQFDFEVVVFEGSEKGQLKVVAHSLRNQGYDRSLSFISKPGAEYRVVLDTYLPNPVRWEVEYNLGPPNDLFIDAIPLSGDLFTATGYNRAATSELFERLRPHATRGRGKSVWWTWTAPYSGDFTINTSGSAFDTVLAIYTGSAPNTLTEIASNDDRLPLDYSSQVSFPAIEGTTYHIAVDSCHENSFGEIALNGFRSNTLQIIRQPANTTVAVGKRAVLDVAALSATWVSYQWFFNGQAIPGQTAANIVIDPVRSSDFGAYHVEVRNNENLAISSTATLSESLVAPKLTWTSGSQAVATNTSVTLSATFSGSTPITYSWTKNGQPIPGDTRSLSFPSTQIVNAGAYRLTATNAAGAATAEFTISVVQSPWDRWEWRRPGVPNASVTDIKVYDGEAFAVSATQLMRSTDGVNWSKSVFPQGFIGTSIAKAGGVFLSLGVNLSNQLRVAKSHDNGVSWTISTPTGFPVNIAKEKITLTSHSGTFIAYNSILNSTGQDYLRSADGISWTPLSATSTTNTSVMLSGEGTIATNGSTLILASSAPGVNGRAIYYRSTDGVTWREYETNVSAGSGSVISMTAFYHGTRFHLVSSHGLFTSTNGVDWQLQSSTIANNFSPDSLIASAGPHIIAFKPGSTTFHHFIDPNTPATIDLYPSNSHRFTAAASFGTMVLYGTDKGMLASASNPSEIGIPKEKPFGLTSLEVTEGLFIARASTSAEPTAQDLVSGDGVTWKPTKLLDTATAVRVGQSRGRYFGRSGTNPFIHTGHNPFELRPVASSGTDLQPSIRFIGELPNGLAIATNTEGSGIALRVREPSSNIWTTASFPQTINSSLRFATHGNRWYSSPEGSVGSPAAILTSTDGMSWSNIGLSGSFPQFLTMNGKSWCVYNSAVSPYTTRVASSTNGTSWTVAPNPIGLPSHSFKKFAKRVVVFGDLLVMLGSDENLYLSEDGTTWVLGAAPGKIIDIATAQGQLVAVMNNGGIIQTGSPHSGLNAPIVQITSPPTVSTHLIGSQISIEGIASDPEDDNTTYECYLDGELVASGTGNSFRFDVSTTNPSGHTVTVRARDSHGLRQIDAIRLNTALPDHDNTLTSINNGFVPSYRAVTLDGIFYTAGKNVVYRSQDGTNWEKVPIPSFLKPIHGMAAGNGSLVIQFADGGIIATRNGINWNHFQPNLTLYGVQDPIKFSSGVFIASYQSSSGSSGSVMTSIDGLTWDSGTESSYGNVAWSAISSPNLIIGAPRHGASVNLTRDGGFNWTPIPLLTSQSSFDSHGIFDGERFLVAVTGSTGKIFTSTDTETWSEHLLPAGISGTPTIGHVGGIYFLGQFSSFSYVSTDAQVWQPMSHSVDIRKIIQSRGLFLAESSSGGIISSRNGLNWSPVPEAPTSASQILANESLYLILTSDGAAWTSEDGSDWDQTMAGGGPTTVDNRIAIGIAELSGRLIASGWGILVTSNDDGRTWQNSDVLAPPPTSSVSYGKPISSGAEILVLQTQFHTQRLLRSTDGVTFTPVESIPSKKWANVCWNGVEWMLLSTDGSLFRSIDGGLSWLELPTTGIIRGSAVIWFNNRWIIIGTILSDSNAPLVTFTLGAGDTFQYHGNIGFSSSSNDIQHLIAHDRLLIWTRNQRAHVSSNGTSWTSSNLNGGDYDIYYTPDGFTALRGTNSVLTPIQVWSSGPEGLSWSGTPPPFNNIYYAENFGDRVFLFTTGLISELYDKDLALTMPALSNTSLGVGDEVSATVTIRNFGQAIPPGGTWKVRAWLAKNRFYGDTRNIPLGTFDITAPMPGPGSSQTYPVSFTLPNNIFTGSNYLILNLVTPEHIRESNTANNTTISDTSFVTIPEWEFNVATNGNGQVNRDFAAARYPHKAQVSLTATAGKGAVFTGWAGDAVSPNNQITILMDGNKSLQANFSNRAHLQVFIQGAGDVTGLADLGSYSSGHTAQITAVPAPGWEFSHWSGASTESTASTSIIMDAPKSVTAQFILPLATWKETYFSASQLADPAVSGDHADFDSDGVTTWQEYLHGSDPTDSKSTGAGPVAISGGFMRRTYTRNLGADQGAGFACRAGRDLISWDAADLQERILSTKDGLETIEAMLPVTGYGEGFLRFEYDDPAP